MARETSYKYLPDILKALGLEANSTTTDKIRYHGDMYKALANQGISPFNVVELHMLLKDKGDFREYVEGCLNDEQLEHFREIFIGFDMYTNYNDEKYL